MGEHWRKPHPKPPVRSRPSALREVAALIRGIFHLEWLPFDPSPSSFKRKLKAGR